MIVLNGWGLCCSMTHRGYYSPLDKYNVDFILCFLGFSHPLPPLLRPAKTALKSLSLGPSLKTKEQYEKRRKLLLGSPLQVHEVI
ncbi:hypothetical protein PRUPE_4G116500 [Prunus persica]|uniref:Uncharacterized protein n=1 Tax=Prunus persica TaxID=3760 RepID=A0A251PMF5_PRUPE|nr:hypothetical protein PRUPE_4G116500 [Prunus persica]